MCLWNSFGLIKVHSQQRHFQERPPELVPLEQTKSIQVSRSRRRANERRCRDVVSKRELEECASSPALYYWNIQAPSQKKGGSKRSGRVRDEITYWGLKLMGW